MKTLVVYLVFFLTSLTATAQIDAKLNAGSALTGGLNLAAETPIGAQSSISVGLAYSSLGLSFDKKEEYRYRNLRVIPGYRYYFAPRDGMDRFFVGAYGKLGRLTGIDRDTDARVSTARVAVGVLAGHKWVAPSGFVFELNAGLGTAATFGGGGNGARGLLYDRAIGALSAVDLRLGILVGYRFPFGDGRRF
ncbi:hypothetical protein LEM8419_00815 [Neolewinella maritima]|uniref:DUF3575 domain-containing protein n=1 Tax=Neolewinella maritima TaxID=1383882 RepID=A0ABM9AXY3_9BACT|nr:DUF3575 domain-containing protein [Neolewinella maritima]CAH0999515.1 hypothetical protein LEM8419_00815 [Neolewinella maritima]